MSDATDADVLLAHMVDRVNDDGSFARNLNVIAAEIGWMPERLSAAMQDLCAQERVLPDHEDGRPDRVASSRWLVIDDSDSAGNDVMTMTVKQLRAYADAHSIDLGDATLKDEIRNAILKAQVEGET